MHHIVSPYSWYNDNEYNDCDRTAVLNHRSPLSLD